MTPEVYVLVYPTETNRVTLRVQYCVKSNSNFVGYFLSLGDLGNPDKLCV